MNTDFQVTINSIDHISSGNNNYSRKFSVEHNIICYEQKLTMHVTSIVIHIITVIYNNNTIKYIYRYMSFV